MVQEGIERLYKDTQIGKKLLEAFTSELYDNCEYVLREYVSNSIDAESSQIDIYIDYKEKDIIIEDNGKGMNIEEINRCLDIMVSPKAQVKKSLFPPIGEIGIGVYSAGKICKDIIVRSKKEDEDYWHIRRIPISQWMDDLKNKDKKYLKEVIISYQKEIKVENVTEKKFHGSIITLHEFYPNKFKEILDPQFTFKFSRIVPVYFENQLDTLNIVDYNLNPDNEGKQSLINEIHSILSGKKFGKIKIDDKISIPLDYNYADIEFHYLNLYDLKKTKDIIIKRPIPIDNILSPKYYYRVKEFKIDNKFVGVGWVVFKGPTETKSTSQFSNFYFRGIIVRLYNVLVYEPKDVWEWAKTDKRSLKSHPLDNLWGEIYLYSEELHPKSSRESIKQSEYWKGLKNQIKEWLINVADSAEKQRKKSQAAKRYLKLFKESYIDLESKIIRFIGQINELNDYELAKKKFNENPSKEENLIGLVKFWKEIINNLDNFLQKFRDKLDINEILNIEDKNELNELEKFLEILKSTAKNTHNSILNKKNSKEIIKSFENKIDQYIQNKKRIICDNDDIIKDIENRKKEEENKEKEKQEEEIRKQQNNLSNKEQNLKDEIKIKEDLIKKEKDLIKEEKERLKKQRELLEKEKLRQLKKQRQIVENVKKEYEEKMKLQQTKFREQKEREKELINRENEKYETMKDHLKPVEKESKFSNNNQLLSQYSKMDNDLNKAKEKFNENKRKIINEDIIKLIPKQIFSSIEKTKKFLGQIFTWVLLNSTIEKDQLISIIKAFN